jgi:hypothetical protein
MVVITEHDIDLDNMMENIGDEIERVISEEEDVNWDCLTDASRKDLYKKIAEYILINWT